MASTMGPKGGFKAEINVTPLVDVVLVLLIIFMVVTPLLGRGRDLDLPRAHSAVPRQQARSAALVLNITPEGDTWRDAHQLSEGELTKLALEAKARDRYVQVLIRSDSRVSVGQLRSVLRTLKRAGVTQIAFAALGEDAKP